MDYRLIRVAILTIGFLLISNISHACYQYSGKTLERKASRFSKAINSASRKYRVNADFIKAVIAVESCFNPRARGTSGEKGLMQLMPGTARLVGARHNYSSWNSIHGGTRYLKSLLIRYNGNKAYAAAAYNGGPGAVSKRHGPRFNRVRRYSNKVMRAYSKLSGNPTYKGKKKYKSRNKSGRSYKVRRGDSLSKIAMKTGVSVKRLKHLNDLKSSRIKVGSRLKISGKSRKSKRNSKTRSKKSRNLSRFYKVRKGDNLNKISKKTGVSVKRLKRLNHLKSTKIKAGKRLKL